jgi:hypothetical protein
MQYYHLSYFAQAYGQSAYSSSTYNGQNTTATGSAANGSTSGGLLTNTGFDVAVVVTVACVAVFAGLVVRFWKKPTKQPAEK